jgi:hypothetical protein
MRCEVKERQKGLFRTRGAGYLIYYVFWVPCFEFLNKMRGLLIHIILNIF